MRITFETRAVLDGHLTEQQCYDLMDLAVGEMTGGQINQYFFEGKYGELVYQTALGRKDEGEASQ